MELAHRGERPIQNVKLLLDGRANFRRPRDPIRGRLGEKCCRRPGSRDDAPILGQGPVEGLIYATGHHRNGILLVPITADAVSRVVLDGAVDPAIAPFGIDRFGPAPARTAAE